ncbi:MAG TPA: response regulator [Candidatus Thermoplasmatota archaeon]|nr:response regulator [Candidatus Thermoplasmatota archaeon]
MKPEQPCNKLLIVDDDIDILSSLQALFEKEGFEVRTAENGRKCLVELEKGFQGIILLDLMMPIMNGIETIKQMHIDGFLEQNLIIVLTVKRIQGDEINEIYPYIQDYITKPFDINMLLQTVKKHAQIYTQKKRR